MNKILLVNPIDKTYSCLLAIFNEYNVVVNFLQPLLHQ